MGIASKKIGIKLWPDPQISLHCPIITPGRLTIKVTWFNRPGVASILTPNDGTAQECNTSLDVTRVRIGTLTGTIKRLETDSKRNKFESTIVDKKLIFPATL